MARSLGIDIGSRHIKVSEVETKIKPEFLNAFIFQTPYLDTPAADGRKRINEKLFWQEITAKIPYLSLKKYTTAVNLPNLSTMTIYLLLPKMKRSELAAVAINEARKKMIPASGPEHVFKWFYLGDKSVSGAIKSEVLVVRTEKVYINEIVELFKSVQLTPTFIVPLYFILPGMLPRDYWKKDLDVTFMNFGEEGLRISVSKEGRVEWVRNVGYGIKDIVQDFMRQTDNNEETVRSIIDQQGIPHIEFDLKDKVAVAEEIMRQKYEIGDEHLAQAPKILPLELRMLWQTHVERVIHELRRSFIYYKEQSSGRRIEYIYFLGGATRIKNFVSTVSSSVGGESKIMDTIAGDPVFAAASGLALINSLELKRYEFVNFLPLEIKKQKIAGIRRFILLVFGIALLFFSSVVSINLFFKNKSAALSIQKLDEDLNEISTVVSNLRNLSAKESEVGVLSSQIEEVLRKRHNFYPVLMDLARVTPKEIVLTRIDLARRNANTGLESGLPAGMVQYEANSSNVQGGCFMLLSAEISADYEEAKAKLEAFQKTLSSLPHFSNIVVTPLGLEKIVPLAMSGQDDGLQLTVKQARKFTIALQLKVNE